MLLPDIGVFLHPLAEHPFRAQELALPLLPPLKQQKLGNLPHLVAQEGRAQRPDELASYYVLLRCPRQPLDPQTSALKTRLSQKQKQPFQSSERPT